MRFNEFARLVHSDLYRHCAGKTGAGIFLKALLNNPGFAYCFWLRACRYTHSHSLTIFTAYPLARLVLRHCTFRFGISIPFNTSIGPGFYIGHFGGIVVNGRAVIGANCNISQGVTIGQSNRGERKGYPVIGDHVYIGPGAKVIGRVRVGHNAAIGANAVVTRDVPDNAVVAGVPAKLISYEGASGYVEHTDYTDQIGSHDD